MGLYADGRGSREYLLDGFLSVARARGLPGLLVSSSTLDLEAMKLAIGVICDLSGRFILV